MDVLMPQLGETVAEGKITKWFKSRRRRREAGRQPVRDRDRQGVDGGAVDHHRHAHRDPRAGRRDRAGRRRGRGDRGRGRRGCERAGSGARGARIEAAAPHAPFVPAKAGTQGQGLGPRVRGDERRGSSFAYPDLDPFFEVRTPSRNFGPAKHPGGTTVTPLARRLAGENGIDLSRCRAPARTAASSPPTSRRPSPRRGGRAAPMAAGMSRGAGEGALPGRRVRGGAARRHARDHRAAAGRGQADHPALLSDRRRDDGCAAENPRGGQRRRARRAAAYKLSVNDFVIKALALALAARAGRQRGVGRRPHPALQAFRRRRRGRDRRRAAHAGDPQRRGQVALRHLQRDEGPRRARQGEEAQARRIPGRLVGDLQSRHVRRARILGDHQSAARHHPRGRRRRSAARSRPTMAR